MFSRTISDAELIVFVDSWVVLLETEDYEAACQSIHHLPETEWTPDLIRAIIKQYGDAEPSQRVTLAGVATDITQRKEVNRWPRNAAGRVGELWYDLNINGTVSDLTATFALRETEDGLTIELNDIHVM